MDQPWIVLPPGEPSPALLDAAGGHALVAGLLAQRGITTAEAARGFLDPAQYTPAPPTRLIGVDRAVECLHAALDDGRNILVWGDFDVDGQTSTSLLVAALHKLAGPERVRFHVPNRFTESHGIKTDKLAQILLQSDIPIHVILTCDTGIAEGPAIGYAKDRGITVLVTDHHDLTPEYAGLNPEVDPLWGMDAADVGQDSVRRADAVVNPKFQPEDDPLRTLPGVGVAYKLVQHLFAVSGHAGDERELLDLVALGIVADVAEQVNDARYLLQRGLEQLRNTRRVGLLALMEQARLDADKVDADSIGFQLGPRMNALGRLEDATVAVELLTTRDALRAGQLAQKMEQLNQQRRLLTSQMAATAMEMLDQHAELLDYNALVLANPNWHAGIVGIVASRLAEEFNKPTVLLLNPPGQPARGSARSVVGVDIGSAIAACDHLLFGHGGHPGAAGMSLDPQNINAFRRELSRQVEVHRRDDVPPGLMIDMEMQLGQLDMAVAEAVQQLAPFGQGNPTPRLLSRRLTVVDDRRMGRDGTHRKMMVKGADDTVLPVIWFNGADVDLPTGPIDLVYNLNINEYRGERSLQLMHVAVRPAVFETVDVDVPMPTVGRTLHDLRREPVTPAQLPGRDVAAWYAEGAELTVADHTPAGEVHLAPRFELLDVPEGSPLVLWSLPPSPSLLRWMLETVKPDEVYVCGVKTSSDALPDVLKQVAAMCKFALRHDGLLDLNRMAARLGTTEAVIRHSLLWMEAKGMIRIQAWAPEGLSGDALQITPGNDRSDRDEVHMVQAELDEQLSEVRAYRRYFQRAQTRELGLTNGERVES